MPKSGDPLDRLREAIDAVAAADAADLLAEARIEARARLRASLTDALAASMLERLHDQSPGSAAPARERRPTRESRSTGESRSTRPAKPAKTAKPAAPAPRATAEHPPADPAWYVYGVIGSDAQLTGSLAGVDPAEPVTTLTEGALAAVASQVPLEEFDEARLREHLADMTWVEATARAHEGVLDHVRQQGTVIPMRMCTVYRTEGGVREMLHREGHALEEALEALAGKAEWGVKAFVSPEPEADTRGAGESGAAYMERKRTERERRQRAMELADEAAAVIHDRLSLLVSDAHVIPLQRPEASGHSGEMVLNGVYLVADDAVDAFREHVRALRAEFEPQGIELVPTGPWPAYNFVPGTIGAAW
jgi:Gas vesicle synthesis protein GvpL/GvpF